MKALVTGGGAVLGQGIIKSLRQSTLDCRILVADPNPLSAGLYWSDKAYRVPMADAVDYGDRMLEIMDRERPDIVFVGTDVELSYFAANRAAIEAQFDTQVVVSDPQVVGIADDKFETARFFEQAGFLPPRSARAEDHAAVAVLIEAVGFPLIVKPRIGARSIGVSVAHSHEDLRKALHGRAGLVVQECVGDDDSEYTAGVLVFDGKAEASIVMRRDLRDGNTYRAYTGAYPELNELVRRFGEALCPHGPVNFQFRIDRNGQPRVFEINARFSGTTPMRAMAGFNEVEMCARKLLYGEAAWQPMPREGVILRFLEEMFVEPACIEAVA